jgi:hypothetical protein
MPSAPTRKLRAKADRAHRHQLVKETLLSDDPEDLLLLCTFVDLNSVSGCGEG